MPKYTRTWFLTYTNPQGASQTIEWPARDALREIKRTLRAAGAKGDMPISWLPIVVPTIDRKS